MLKSLIENNQHFDLVYAIGPPLMMKAVVDLTKNYGIKSVVSLNCIMVDGCGMCGACRITVGDQTKFACVDVPEFEGDIVDFDELTFRLNVFRQKEIQALKNLKTYLTKNKVSQKLICNQSRHLSFFEFHVYLFGQKFN